MATDIFFAILADLLYSIGWHDMLHHFDKKDKILTAIFCAFPIIITAFGGALINWKGPWQGTWALPNILIIAGLFGWMIIPGVLFQYNSNKRNRFFADGKLLIYGCGLLGLLLGLLAAYYSDRDPIMAFGLALIGAFWGSAFAQLNKPGGKTGIMISIVLAFLTWTIISIYFTKANYLFSILIGVVGIIFVGFIGGFIGPVVHQIRHSDIKLRWF